MTNRTTRHHLFLSLAAICLIFFFQNCGQPFASLSSSSSTSSNSLGGGSSDSSAGGSGSGSTGSNSSLTVPTNVQIVVQGQDKQATSNGAEPVNANHLTLAWKSVNGALSYNIYRSVDRGAYTLYMNISASAATSFYATYVSNSGSIDYQTNVDSAFQDTTATNCVGSYGAQISNGQLRSPGSGGVYHAPDSNGTYFMPNIGYTYKVSAVTSSGESTLSTDSIAVFFAGGLKIMNHQNGLFNGTISYKDTGANGASPLGHTVNAKWTTDASNSYINPYTGGGAVDGNFSVKGFNYLILNVQAAQDGSSFTLEPEIAGDTLLLGTPSNPYVHLSSTSYGTLVKNKWVTLKIPLSDLMTDQIGGKNAPQYAFYKVTLDSHRANETYWIEWYFSAN